MSTGTVNRIYLYKRYERFWHWSQAVMVIFMLITGFEIHGTYHNFGFETAVRLHTLTAWALLTLWAFTIFWQFTTGEWKQYIPTLNKVIAMARYYAYGIFVHAPHPFAKTVEKKHNPLQRLAYVALLAAVSPLIWGSGILYIAYAYWKPLGLDRYLDIEYVAWAHTAGAFMMLTFFIVHVYLTTTGHTITAHIKAMVVGYEDAEEEHAPAAQAAPTPKA
jgi:thiosulfate reductase cytochrome b subunit